MNAPHERIDVLAVMEKARALAADQRDMHDDNNNTPMADSWESFRADVVAARAAVAELIEADKEYDAACGRIYDQPSGYEPSAEEWDRFYVAEHRRAAALARVQGGQP